MDLKLGDCLGEEGLCTLADKSVDMILCDLPYGITANKWDKGLDLNALFQEYNRVIKDNGAIVLFGSQPFTTDLISANRKYFRYELIWEKQQGSDFFNAKKKPLRAHENILVFCKQGRPCYYPQMREGTPYTDKRKRTLYVPNIGTSIEQNYVKVNKGERFPISIFKCSKEQGKHTTQKPVALCEWLIKTYTNEGDLVLDNTFGSGTTAVACKNTNRRFVGWEKEETYYKIALERL
jgi:site-specific DNA-methyltransferase (adenine-specific)